MCRAMRKFDRDGNIDPGAADLGELVIKVGWADVGVGALAGVGATVGQTLQEYSFSVTSCTPGENLWVSLARGIIMTKSLWLPLVLASPTVP